MEEKAKMEAIRDLWENSPLSASQIALRFETTKGTIIGMAARRGWKSHNPGPRHRREALNSPSIPATTSERLESLHKKMDQILGLDGNGCWSPSGRWVPGKKREPEL